MKFFLWPREAIDDVKKDKSFFKVLLLLLLSSIFFLFGDLFLHYANGSFDTSQLFGSIFFSSISDASLRSIAGIIVDITVPFFGGLFFGYIFREIIQIVEGKGSWFAGTTAVTFFLVHSTLGFLLFSLIQAVPYGQVSFSLAKFVLGFMVFSFFIARSYASFIRAMKIMFETDYIVSLIPLLIGISFFSLVYFFLLFATIFRIAI